MPGGPLRLCPPGRHAPTRAPRLAAALGLALGLSLGASTSRADPSKELCIDADAKAQDLRRDHKLGLAREQLMVCAAASCPGVVRSDCQKQLAIVEAAQPTVIFDVVDEAGGRVNGVKLWVDGVAVPSTDGGTVAVLDPGQHTVKLSAAGHEPVTRTITVAEGDKGHHEHVEMAAQSALAPEKAAPAPLPEAGLGTQRQLAIGAGGAGVVMLVVGTIFGVLTLNEKSQQESDCASTCSAASRAAALNDHSSGITDSTVSTVGFIAGGALLGAGAVLFFTAHPSSSAPEPAPAVSLLPAVGPGAGQMLLVGRF